MQLNKKYDVPTVYGLTYGLYSHNEWLLHFLTSALYCSDDNKLYKGALFSKGEVWDSLCFDWEEKARGIIPEMNYYFESNNVRICFSSMDFEREGMTLDKVLMSSTYLPPYIGHPILVFAFYEKLLLSEDLLIN